MESCVCVCGNNEKTLQSNGMASATRARPRTTHWEKSRPRIFVFPPKFCSLAFTRNEDIVSLQPCMSANIDHVVVYFQCVFNWFATIAYRSQHLLSIVRSNNGSITGSRSMLVTWVEWCKHMPRGPCMVCMSSSSLKHGITTTITGMNDVEGARHVRRMRRRVMTSSRFLCKQTGQNGLSTYFKHFGSHLNWQSICSTSRIEPPWMGAYVWDCARAHQFIYRQRKVSWESVFPIGCLCLQQGNTFVRL